MREEKIRAELIKELNDNEIIYLSKKLNKTKARIVQLGKDFIINNNFDKLSQIVNSYCPGCTSPCTKLVLKNRLIRLYLNLYGLRNL
jgi:predicted methyltransferase